MYLNRIRFDPPSLRPQFVHSTVNYSKRSDDPDLHGVFDSRTSSFSLDFPHGCAQPSSSPMKANRGRGAPIPYTPRIRGSKTALFEVFTLIKKKSTSTVEPGLTVKLRFVD